MRTAIARRIRSERGIALPITISVLLIAGLLGVAAAGTAMTSVQDSTRDRSVKRAVESADAGLDIAQLRHNKLAPVVTGTAQCVVVGGSGTLTTEPVQADGWCRAQTESLEDNASYSYRVSGRSLVTIGGEDYWRRKVVSTGLVSGVERRAVDTVTAPKTAPVFPSGVFSHLNLTMTGSSEVNSEIPNIDSDVMSNGNVIVNSPAQICGDVKVGPGSSYSGNTTCVGTVTQLTEPFVLDPVVIPATNDNANLTSGVDPKVGAVVWDATTRVLVVTANGTVTLRGSNYVFCGIHLSLGGRIIIEDDGTPVKMYIDKPENCTVGDPSPGSVYFEKKGRIDSLGPASLAQVYMAGSATIPTSMTFDNNEAQGVEMTFYGPNSSFSIQNHGFLIGAVAAKQVTMANNSEIQFDSSAMTILKDIPEAYTRDAWVECTPAPTGTAPDSGC